MDRFHTIVVGGGPAGLSCAAALAAAGRKVLLLERNQAIGPKVCAGGLPASCLALGVPDQILERRFSRQVIRSPWQRLAITADRPMIATVNRLQLGQWLLARARQAGVTVRSGEPVRQISERQVATDRGRYGYRYLVGADGSSSLLRRWLGLPAPQQGIGITYQVAGTFPELEWHLDCRLFRSGYAWIFPHRQSASVGAYVFRELVPASRLREKVLAWAGQYGISLEGSRPGAALINVDYQGWRFGNRFLVGDAAGLASPLTGEGIYAALVSGQAAAGAILDPAQRDPRLEALLRRHRQHRRLLKLVSGNRLLCRLTMETLVLGLRLGLVPCHAVEMGGGSLRREE